MTFRIGLWGLALFALASGQAAAQTNQLRGLPQSGNSQLPSAEQQLNQNLSRQRNDFSTQMRIDRANRLNRTEQINRLNAQPEPSADPCAGTGSPCDIKE